MRPVGTLFQGERSGYKLNARYRQEQPPAASAIPKKRCLIIDEADALVANDRSGLAAIQKLITDTKIPIICIVHDRGSQRLKPLLGITYNLLFKRPQLQAIRDRIIRIVRTSVRSDGRPCFY